MMSNAQLKNDTESLAMANNAFEKFPTAVTDVLHELRRLILDVAKQDANVGELSEAMRWGQLSFLTDSPKTGSMIRLGLSKDEKPALFFHCGTTLVETFRAQCGHLFDFEGNRAVIIRDPVESTEKELRSCISQALKYKLA